MSRWDRFIDFVDSATDVITSLVALLIMLGSFFALCFLVAALVVEVAG